MISSTDRIKLTAPHNRTITGRQRRQESGVTLVVTLLLALVIMVALDGFLSFLSSEYRLVHRTFSYGNAIYVAEAGIEEGFAVINYGSNDWSGTGWSVFYSTNYTKSVSSFSPLGSSTAVGRYTVNIYGATNDHPVIVCTGVVDTASAMVVGSSNSNVTRVVRVVLGKRPMFQWGLLSQSQINLNGNSIDIDSFDSSDPSYSNYDYSKGFGTYDSGKKKDNGDMASNGGITNTISVGNANVYGHASTGVGGAVGVGPNGFISALGQAQSGVIDSNRVSHSMNVDIPTPTLPSGFSSFNLGAISGSTTISGGSSTPVDYTASSINLTGGNTITFSSGYSRLYVTGNISVGGTASIVIASGAKLEIYVVGTTSIAGNGVANNNQLATNFQLYGLGSSSVSVSGNGQLTGIIYAPQSAVTFSGGGASGAVAGAVVGNTITLGGHTEFHYDEALKNYGPTRGYSIVAWQEL